MKRLLTVSVAVVLGGTAIASASLSAGSEDQPTADAAIAELEVVLGAARVERPSTLKAR